MNENTQKVLVVSALGVGGVSTLMTNIQARLDRSQINFDYLVFHDERPYRADFVEGLGSKIYVASVDYLKHQALRRVARMIKIAKICRRNHIDILHYNADFSADLTNIIAAKIGGVKHVTMHAHNASFTVPGKSVQIMSKVLKPFIPLFVDDCWACSNLAGAFVFPKRILSSKKYQMVPNGIELKKFDFDQQKRKRIRLENNADDKFIIGHAGRFVDQKNHDFLIDVFFHIQKKDPNVVLWLFGGGVLFDEIRQKAESLGIDEKIKFFGVKDNMYDMWQALDVFVMPSLHEGLPVAAIEAQASGLQCVFSDTITSEVDVSGNSVFLSLKSSAEVWADKVLELKHSQTIRISGLAKLREKNYDIDQMAETFANHYIDVSRKLSK